MPSASNSSAERRSLSLSADVRARALHDLDGQPSRREPPPGAIACFGAEWARIVELLADPIGKALPSVRHHQTVWILRAQHADDDRIGVTPAEHEGVQGTFVAAWPLVMRVIEPEVMQACPEIKGRNIWSIVRARSNGVRIEFFANEEAWKHRRDSAAADVYDGTKIGKARLVIEFLEDRDALIKRLAQLVDEIGVLAQAHAGELTWM